MNFLQRFPTLSAAGSAVRRRELSCRDLVDGLLQRIEAHDASLRAWVEVAAEAAREAASHADENNSERQHALHGITLGVKDIIDVQGVATLAASPIRSHEKRPRDAAIVRQLRAAGAIVLGKTATTQWAFLDPAPTRNPWNADRTPGGSSSGSAAAVAARMCHVALGTQTGGSVIRPAAFCGVFGFMFAPDVVDPVGILPLAPTLDRPGLLAGDMHDLRRCYAVLAGGQDAPSPMDDRTGSQMIRVIRAPWIERASPAVASRYQTAVEELTARLRAVGMEAELVDCDLSHAFAGVAAAHFRVMAVEAAQVHGEAVGAQPEGFATEITNLIRQGEATSEKNYRTALDRLQQWGADVRQLLGAGEVLVMPSAPTTAPTRETTGDPSFNSPWTAAGTPVLTVPIGQADDGLQVGLQLIAAAGAEDRLCAVGQSFADDVRFPQLS